MRILNYFILFFILSSVSFATTTLESVSGASNSVRTTAADGTTSSWKIYGGISGANASTFTGCSTGGTCNTCIGAYADAACNPAAVFADTVITFSGTTTVTGATSRWLLCSGTTDLAPPSANLQTAISTTWGNICGVITSGNTNCAQAMASSSTVYFGAGVDCSSLASTEKVAVQFISHFVDPTATNSVYTDCPDASAVSGGYGACHFTLFPGDGKVYVDNFIVDSTFPSPAAGVTSTIDNIYFFFVEVLNGELDGDAAARISNDAKDSISTSYLPVSSERSLGGSYIDGLENDKRYCFRMASQDQTKHIQYFTPLTVVCPAATGPCDDICMTPSEVVGILSDKKCFIATAAFGSEMDSHVQMLRQFRNKFMAPFWMGRKLVKIYYKISPPVARWISDKENVKSLVRGILWPIMGWTELALKYGWSVVVAPFLFLGLALILIRRRTFLRSKKI